VAYNAVLDNRKLTFFADDISPEQRHSKTRKRVPLTLAGWGLARSKAAS
jgi:hypothetical protein